MKTTLLRNMLAAIATLFIALFALPQTAQAQSLTIDGTEVDLSTSKDLTGSWLEKGKVHWDAATKTLTLDNATLVSKNNSFNFILTTKLEYTLRLKGSNAVTATGWNGISASLGSVTINGGGKLAITAPNVALLCVASFDKSNTLTIEDCTIETEQKIKGDLRYESALVVKNATLASGMIYDYKSISLVGCKIQIPVNGKVKDAANSTKTIADAEGNMAEKVKIVPAPTAIEAVSADTAKKQGTYNLHGVRLGTSPDRLPAGIYIVDGKKVAKP